MLLRISLGISCASLALFVAGCGSDDSGADGAPSSGGAGGSGGSGGAAGSSGASGAAGAIPTGTEIPTDLGPLSGTVVGKTRAFLGVPFAKPPLGELRFAAPVPMDEWTAPRDATKKGPACAQFGSIGASIGDQEDCLYLNVWTPDPAPDHPLPVMVWIHGGAFVLGSGSDAAYDGQALSEAGGVVVVTVNHRLGPLGFLANDAFASQTDAPANWGIMDQQAALRWVQANAHAFGGDAGNVTLFGESAGGMSACIHLVAPASRDLLQRAIIQSGPCELVTRGEAGTRASGTKLIADVGCDTASDVPTCLRGKTLDELSKTSKTDLAKLFTAEATTWFPVGDGTVIPSDVSKAFADGDFAKVPVIVGSNRDEGTLFVGFSYPNEVTQAQYEQALAAAASGFLGIDSADPVLAEYPASDFATPKDALSQVLGDAGFTCPTRRLARALAAGGTATYRYSFEYVSPNLLFGDIGSYHSAEIPFVLGNAGAMSGATPAKAKPLQTAMMGYWSRFADAGDPNGGDDPVWPRHTTAAQAHIVLNLPIETGQDLLKEKCDFWDSL